MPSIELRVELKESVTSVAKPTKHFKATYTWIKVKNDHRSKFSNLGNWKERTRDLRDTGAMLYQLSYKATHWERDQFIEFISPVRSEVMWRIYEVIHIFELRL